MNTLPDKELLRVGEVAVYLGFHERTIRTWIKQGKLKARRVAGHGIKIPHEEVMKCQQEISH